MTYRILTVCTGNICRSPMAEVILQSAADEAGMDVQVQSAAVTGYEVGNPIDYRAQKVLQRAGYDVPRRAAQRITRQDLAHYDLILPMTREHQRAIQRLSSGVPEGRRADVRLFGEFAQNASNGPILDVPDPWYGDMADFEETLEILEDGTAGVLAFAEQSS